MTGERDGDTDRQAETAAAEELTHRDLGAGHPLSPESDRSEQPVPTDIDTDRSESGEAGATGQETPAGEWTDTTQESTGSSFGRRDLLLGGAAGAVAASLGWLGVFATSGGGGPSGDAETVAADYVTALADNDWEAAGALFHEDSEFRQEADSYETYLDDRDQLDVFTDISPSVEAQYVRLHIPDVAEAVEADDNFALRGGIDPAGISEWKQILVIASVRVRNLNLSDRAESDYLSVSITVDFDITLVRDSRGWHISQTFGSPLVF
jgi:hypothetical protein